MPTAPSTTVLPGDIPPTIKGVSLFNKNGKLKSRYSWNEKLQMLGCTEHQLQAFVDLLAPRKSPYGLRRATNTDTGKWFTVKRELTLDLIAWHLLGACIPNRHPLWIGPRAWDWTKFVAIDVDLRHGNEIDFEHRCRQVEEAFLRLEVAPESWLVVPTPSGGRHYYFFTSDKIRTAEIVPTMAQVGIVASKGKFEVFPSTAQVLRLPFGHIPRHPHQPGEWIRFIDHYRTSEFPAVNWEECKHVAKKHATSRKAPTTLFPPEQEDSPAKVCERQSERKPTIRSIEHSPVGMSKVDRQKRQSYEKLLSRPVESPADIEHLLDLGICCDGTRHEAIMRLAWNFVFVRGCKEDDAIREIAEWAYRTGEGTSKDVDADLEQGSHRVEDDATELVQHFVRLRDIQGSASACLFADEEVDAIKTATIDVESRLRFARGRFLAEFLRFAKTNGWPTMKGWECRPAAQGIMRKWRGCSGQRYKSHLDWAMRQGILVMTKDKRQTQDRTGCPRTFLLRMPMTTRAAWRLTRVNVLAQLKQFSIDLKNASNGTARPCEKSDRYLVGFPTKEENKEKKERASDPTPETVQKETEETVERTRPDSLTGNGPIGPANEACKGNDAHAKRPINPANDAGTGDTVPAPTTAHSDCTGIGNPRGEHQRRAVCHLATGTPERPLVEPAVQDVHHSPAGPVPAVPYRRQIRWHGRYKRDPGRRHERDRFAISPPHAPPPTAIDAADVRQTIAAVKAALAAAYPDKVTDIDHHPTWPLIEEMAIDPSYSGNQRYVLLANPMFLAPSQLAFRKELIRQYRDTLLTTAHRPPKPRFAAKSHRISGIIRVRTDRTDNQSTKNDHKRRRAQRNTRSALSGSANSNNGETSCRNEQ